MFTVTTNAVWARGGKEVENPFFYLSSTSLGELSDRINDPTIHSSVNQITLTFSTTLAKPVTEDMIQVYEISESGQQVRCPINITVSDMNIVLTKKTTDNAGSWIPGEECLIIVNNSLKSVNETPLYHTYQSYFSFSYDFILNENGNRFLDGRKETIVISDIHLGMNSDYAECTENRKDLVTFLKGIRTSLNVKELVIAGDLIDEWFIPASESTFGTGNQRDFVKAVSANNQEVFDALNSIIADKKVKITYVPGNHDLLITSDDIQSILPGINEARDKDRSQGLGTYTSEDSKIAVEHGHRYNFFCAPDPISNKDIAKNSILPPGYFFTRIATTHVTEKSEIQGDKPVVVDKNKVPDTDSQKLLYEYWNGWIGLVQSFPIREKCDDKIIVTNIDGFTAHYSINDILPYQSANGSLNLVLSKGIQDNWLDREVYNNVPVKIPTLDAITKAGDNTFTDQQAKTQYFDNANSKSRIVVFGHTHVVQNESDQNKTGKNYVYANSGTWIDKKNPNDKIPKKTFIVITDGGVTKPTYVTSYQYCTAESFTFLGAHAIMNFDK